MTILEELVQIVHALGADGQRQVLELATKLRDSEKQPDLSLAGINTTDDASWDAWSERVRERSAAVLDEEKRRLQALGLIDNAWKSQTADLPADMLPSSKTSVAT